MKTYNKNRFLAVLGGLTDSQVSVLRFALFSDNRLPRESAKRLIGFHAYRRKWATERKHLPVKDVAEAGGWLDTRSLDRCYQHADEHTLLQVVCEPRKLRETMPETIPPGGGNGTAPQRQTAAGP